MVLKSYQKYTQRNTEEELPILTWVGMESEKLLPSPEQQTNFLLKKQNMLKLIIAMAFKFSKFNSKKNIL